MSAGDRFLYRTRVEVARRSGLRGPLRMLVALALVLLSVPVLLARPSTAQAASLVEVSASCVAIGQRFPTLTVWGSGFEPWLAATGSTLTVEWSWGGAPSFPNPASVAPLTRAAPAGTFTLTFDVTGVSEGLGGFGRHRRPELCSARRRSSGLPTSTSVRRARSGPPRAAPHPARRRSLVSTTGYDPPGRRFFYQYHLPDQVGPVSGTAAADGSVRAQFQPAPQSANATVTAQISQPAEGDFSAETFYNTSPCPSATTCRRVVDHTERLRLRHGERRLGVGSGGVQRGETGTLAAPISDVGIGGGQAGDFVVDNNGCNGVTLAANASCAVTVHFAPGAAGSRTATLTAASSNSATASAFLSGTGERPPGLSITPPTKDFGSVPEQGSSAPTVFTVTNTGSGPQTITSVTLTGSRAGEFAVDADTCASALLAGGAPAR